MRTHFIINMKDCSVHPEEHSLSITNISTGPDIGPDQMFRDSYITVNEFTMSQSLARSSVLTRSTEFTNEYTQLIFFKFYIVHSMKILVF